MRLSARWKADHGRAGTRLTNYDGSSSSADPAARVPVTCIFIVALTLLCDMPARVYFGSERTLSSILAVVSVVALSAFLFNLVFGRRSLLSKALVGYWGFLFWMILCLMGRGSTTAGIQVAVVTGSFVLVSTCVSMLSLAESEQLLRLLRAASLWVSGTYIAQVAILGTNSNGVFAARTFALEGVVLLAVTLALPKPRRWHRLAPAIVFAAIFLSLSRTALAASALTWGLYAGIVRGRRYWAVVSLAFMGVTGFLLQEVVMRFSPLRDRFLVGEIGAGGINFTGRTPMWNALEARLSGNLFYGFGPGAASVFVTRFFAPLTQPHNDYLRLMYDVGLVGLILWALGAVAVFVSLARKVPTASAHTAVAGLLGFVGILICMVTDNPIVYLHVMVPLGAIVGAGLGALKPPSLGDERFLPTRCEEQDAVVPDAVVPMRRSS